MITFNYQTAFVLKNESQTSSWVQKIIDSEGYQTGDISYVFCDDNYLNTMNVEFLSHDTYTDIISFDYSSGKHLQGEIYISIQRVAENAKEFHTSFENELHRVIVHGILHFMGYKDKTTEEKKAMRIKENNSLKKLTH